MTDHRDDRNDRGDDLMLDRELREALADWRESTSRPPADLRDRVLARTAEAVAARGAAEPVSTGVGIRTLRRPEAGRAPRSRVVRLLTGRPAMALAATILLALVLTLAAPGVFEPEVISVSGNLLVDDALDRVLEAERAHAEAIAALAAAAEPILQAAADPATPPSEAARLRAYRDRLAAIDDSIRQLRDYLDSNPGHPNARTLLLAAYVDKTELLRTILSPNSMENA